MAPNSSTHAWKIPWMEEPGRLQSMGLRRVGHDWAISLSLFIFMHWRRKWQPTPVFLPGESQGWEPGGLLSMGSHRVGHDWSDLAVAVIILATTLKVYVSEKFKVGKALTFPTWKRFLIFNLPTLHKFYALINLLEGQW